MSCIYSRINTPVWYHMCSTWSIRLPEYTYSVETLIYRTFELLWREFVVLDPKYGAKIPPKYGQVSPPPIPMV